MNPEVSPGRGFDPIAFLTAVDELLMRELTVSEFEEIKAQQEFEECPPAGHA